MWLMRQDCWKQGAQWHWAVLVENGDRTINEGRADTEDEALRQMTEAAGFLEATHALSELAA